MINYKSIYINFFASATQIEGVANFLEFADAWLCAVPDGCFDSYWDRDDSNSINFIDFAMIADDGDFNGFCENQHRYILTDFHNSVVGITDANGVITEIAYNAWGTPSYSGYIEGLSILWNGYYYDSETGNYYLRNRYYSPIERKFITEDPRGIKPDENWNNRFSILSQYDDGFGLEVYAEGDSINGRDDWGLACVYKVGICSRDLTPKKEGIVVLPNREVIYVKNEPYYHQDVRLQKFGGPKGRDQLIEEITKGFFADDQTEAIIAYLMSKINLDTGWVSGHTGLKEVGNCSMSVVTKEEYYKIRYRFINFNPTSYHLEQFNCQHWANFVLNGNLATPGFRH